MVTFLMVLLIISQLICFYFIIILNMKVAKFKDLEVRQDKLIREMDDAISVYLLEMREENNRLIKELSNMNKNEIENIEKNVMNLGNDRFNETDTTQGSATGKESVLEQKNLIPKTIVKNAYNRQKEQASTNLKQNHQELFQRKVEEEKVIENLPTFEQQVVKLHHEGKTVEEIAKITQKGKTEIELLIKFHV